MLRREKHRALDPGKACPPQPGGGDSGPESEEKEDRAAGEMPDIRDAVIDEGTGG